jgi:hypothetical protein
MPTIGRFILFVLTFFIGFFFFRKEKMEISAALAGSPVQPPLAAHPGLVVAFPYPVHRCSVFVACCPAANRHPAVRIAPVRLRRRRFSGPWCAGSSSWLGPRRRRFARPCTGGGVSKHQTGRRTFGLFTQAPQRGTQHIQLGQPPPQFRQRFSTKAPHIGVHGLHGFTRILAGLCDRIAHVLDGCGAALNVLQCGRQLGRTVCRPRATG